MDLVVNGDETGEGFQVGDLVDVEEDFTSRPGYYRSAGVARVAKVGVRMMKGGSLCCVTGDMADVT